jgi:hypothetical protein
MEEWEDRERFEANALEQQVNNILGNKPPLPTFFGWHLEANRKITDRDGTRAKMLEINRDTANRHYITVGVLPFAAKELLPSDTFLQQGHYPVFQVLGSVTMEEGSSLEYCLQVDISTTTDNL